MRSSDVVLQLAAVLPRFVDDFTTQIAVVSLTRSGTTVTVETAAAHGLTAGRAVNIVGALTPLPCGVTRSGTVGTLVTTQDHDITENAGFDVQISGATEPEFNGTFQLLRVLNRRTITFLMSDAGALVAAGAPVLLNGASPLQQYNGLRAVTAVPSATSFQYEVTDATLPTPALGSITVKAAPRISSSVTYERAEAAYTKQADGAAWLFAVVGDAVASKSRAVNTDAVDNIQSGHYFNQRLIQNVSLYVFLPTSAQIAGSGARDRCEELLRPICQSVAGVRFPSLVENDNNPLMLVGHGLQAYTAAFYVHQYNFEATIQLGPTDIYTPDDDVAFRDIALTMGLDVGTETFNTLINLDDEPTP